MTATTYKARAFLAAAERLGVPVVVGTDRPPVLAGLNPPATWCCLRRAGRAAAKVAAYAAEHPGVAVAAVVAADDDGTVLAARAARALGLAGNPVAAVETARDKHRARQAWAAAGLAQPPFTLCRPRRATRRPPARGWATRACSSRSTWRRARE